MPPPIPLGTSKSAERYLGQSTVAGLPDPTTVPDGGYYEMTDAGSAYAITWAIGDKAISNGTSYAKKLVPVAKVVDGGTGANNADDAALPENLNFFDRESVEFRHNSSRAEPSLIGANNSVIIGPQFLSGVELNDQFTILARVRFHRPVSSNAFVCMTSGSSSALNGAHHAGILLKSDDSVFVRAYDGAFKDAESVSVADMEFGKTFTIGIRLDSVNDGLAAFANGKKKIVTASGPQTHTTGHFHIGCSDRDQSSIEVLGLVVYTRALTDSEILEAHERLLAVKNVDRWAGETGGLLSLDFSGDSTEGLTVDGSNGPSIDVAATVGGDTDNLKLVAGGSTGVTRMWKVVTGSVGKRVTIEGEYYVPSGQTYVDGFQLGVNVSAPAGNWAQISAAGTDEWLPFKVLLDEPIDPSNQSFYIRLLDGTSITINGAASGEFVAFRGIKASIVGCGAEYKADNVVGSRAIDLSLNNHDGAVSGFSALSRPGGRDLHSPSDLATDMVEQVTAGASKTTLLQRFGTGLQRGVLARQVSSGNGYEQIVEVSLAVDATVVVGDLLLGNDKGWADVIQSSGTAQGWAKLALEGDVADPAILEDRHTLWSVTKDAASKINVYRDAGASNVLTIQNKTAAIIQLTIRLLGTQLS